ncbi:MAG: DNA primase [Candidatus Eremiobacteraeota bacterium]|nr:DNA primase [Candidatus Eremiobacteraeota bacterium]
MSVNTPANRSLQSAMRIDPTAIREIHARTDLASLVGSFVSLRKQGRDLVGLCPFHSERTPSFHVHPQEGYFKCFGCGAYGDAIAFMQRIESLTFPDAARVLATRAGVELAAETPADARRRSERETIYEANKVAAAFFARSLQSEEGADARRYCERRSIHPATIERFALGYAPESWDALVNELRRSGVDLALAAKAGLVKPRQSGGYYDFYRNRLMIPTLSTTGEIIAFGGRALGDAEQKYVNTSATPVYTKGHHVFALNLARRAAAAEGSLIVVEGYLDCIALHQAGFENTVASLGTAFTEDQARQLRKYAEHIYVCFDADAAGSAAAEKAIETAVGVIENAGSSVRVVTLPKGEDPDSFVRAQGADAFRRLVDESKPAVEFRLERELARLQTGFDSPSMIAQKGEALIREMTPVAEWDKWRVYVAGRLKIRPNDLRNSRFLANAANFVPRGPVRLGSRHVAPSFQPSSYEREILAIVLEEPGLLVEYAAELPPPSRFVNEIYRKIYQRLLEEAPPLRTSADIYALFAEDSAVADVLSALQKPDRSSTVRYADTEERRLHLERIIKRLQLEAEKERYQELSRQIDELVGAGKEVPADLRSDYDALVAKLKK